MALGFVLITSSPDKGLEVYEDLLRVSEVTEVHPLFGEFDLIAKLEAPDPDALATLVSSKIRAIDGVTDTKTLTEMRG